MFEEKRTGDNAPTRGEIRSRRPNATLDKRRWREFLYREGDGILEKAVDLAKQGDHAMIKLCVERMLPALKAVEHSGEVGGAMPTIELTLSVGPDAPKLVGDATLGLAREGNQEALAELGELLLVAAPVGMPKDA